MATQAIDPSSVVLQARGVTVRAIHGLSVFSFTDDP